MKTTTMIACGAAAFAAFASQAADLVIAERGRTNEWQVVLPANPTPSEAYAAEEFVKWTEELTGVALPVAKGKKTMPHAVILRAPEPSLNFGTDGFNVRAVGGDVVVRGGRRGIIYGVNELLETYGGIGWFAPDRWTVPTTGIFKVPDNLYDTQKPAFEVRETDWLWTWRPGDVNEGMERKRKFGVRVRLNGGMSTGLRDEFGGQACRFVHPTSLCHTFLRILPTKKYFAAHPEWYSEINGVRRSGETQLCLTNPEMLEQYVTNLVECIDKDPKANFYGVSQDDWYNNCQCAKCKAVDAEEGSPSGTLIRFVNAVAERVDKARPGLTCETLAYQYTRHVPKHARPASNVVVCLCNIECDWAQPFSAEGSAANAAFLKDLAEWHAITDKLFVWDYSTNYRWPFHAFPNLGAYQQNFKIFRDYGVACLFEEGHTAYYADFAALKCWLAAKWMWNPDLPAEPLMARFFDGFYGAGAPYARAVSDKFNAALASAPKANRHLGIFENDRVAVYSDALLDECLALWRKAEDAAKPTGDAGALANVRAGMAATVATLLDRAAAKTRFHWATRSPEKFTTFESVADKYAWMLGWIAETERAKKPCYHSTFGYTNSSNTWARASRVKRPAAPSDSATICAADVLLIHPGTWSMLMNDAAAACGRAVKLPPIQDAPGCSYSFGNLAYDAGADYEVRVRVRVDRVPGGKGEAFRAAVDGTKLELAPRVENLADGWQWHSLGAFRPSDSHRLTFGIGRFKNGGGQNAVNAVYLDCVEVRRAEK